MYAVCCDLLKFGNSAKGYGMGKIAMIMEDVWPMLNYEVKVPHAIFHEFSSSLYANKNVQGSPVYCVEFCIDAGFRDHTRRDDSLSSLGGTKKDVALSCFRLILTLTALSFDSLSSRTAFCSISFFLHNSRRQ